MRTLSFILAAALALTAAGCAAQSTMQQQAAGPSAAPSPVQESAPSPTAAPSPTPEQPDMTEAESLLTYIWNESARLALGLGMKYPDNFLAGDELWNVHGTEDADRAWLPVIEGEAQLALSEALEHTAALFESLYAADYGMRVSLSESSSYPTWQYIYALTRGCGGADAAAELIAFAVRPELSFAEGDGFALTLSPIPHQEAMLLPGGGEPAAMGRTFQYCYCNTVFNELGEFKEYVQPPAEGSLAEGIVWPLGSHTRLRKTWFADRDGGARRHTGTDIWAEPDTEIYSCTDGTITYIGYSEGAGHTVIVLDEYGYEFHYYHLIRQPDFIEEGQTVSAGELIGHVGNTGNSSLDHLHLTIAAPEGYYVNPYPYLEAVEPAQSGE